MVTVFFAKIPAQWAIPGPPQESINYQPAATSERMSLTCTGDVKYTACIKYLYLLANLYSALSDLLCTGVVPYIDNTVCALCSMICVASIANMASHSRKILDSLIGHASFGYMKLKLWHTCFFLPSSQNYKYKWFCLIWLPQKVSLCHTTGYKTKASIF